MSVVPQVVLVSFLLLAPLMFALFPPRRAVIAGFLLGWLFLPVAGLKIHGLPDISKTYMVSMGVLLGVAIFNPGRLLMFRPRWFDVPLMIWCLVPMLSSITAGLGIYDGLSAVFKQVMTWGVPYYLGRVYFTDLGGLRDLAVGVVIGGVLYAPLCLWEVRMAPTLHHTLYGYHQHSFAQHMRDGGYRPMVFMQHGLMVAMWMTWATVAAWWLWRSGAMRTLAGVPMGLVTGGLAVTLLLCKSIGPLGLAVAGVMLFYTTRRLQWRWAVWALIVMVPLYIGARASGAWSGASAVEAARMLAGPERARSLDGRIRNETILAERALQRPLFGWGGWDKWRVRDDSGRDISTSDGLWVIALGQNGIVGLAAVTLATLLPGALMLWRWPMQWWADPRVAPAAVLAVLMVLWAVDNLLNAMINPVYLLALGGLVALPGLAAVTRERAPALSVPMRRPSVAQPAAARQAWGS